MNRCHAELCPSWAGDGCVCSVFGIDPPISTLTGDPCLHSPDRRCIECVADDEVTLPVPGVIALERRCPRCRLS